MRTSTYISGWHRLAASEPWIRLPAAPWSHIEPLLATARVALWPLAVEARGRRGADAPLVDDATLDALGRAASDERQCLPLLDHAGPEAGRWWSERPLGPAPVPAPSSGRTPLPLDSDGWASIAQGYGEAAARLMGAGVSRALLGVDEDGLLASTLSPRANPGRSFDERLEPVLAIVRTVREAGVELGVALTVEELCPSGLDATGGIAAARALVEAGAHLIVASGGSEALPVLKHRTGAKGPDDVWLASAAWLVGKVQVPVLAQGPCPDPARARRSARALGIAGVVELRG